MGRPHQRGVQRYLWPKWTGSWQSAWHDRLAKEFMISRKRADLACKLIFLQLHQEDVWRALGQGSRCKEQHQRAGRRRYSTRGLEQSWRMPIYAKSPPTTDLPLIESPTPSQPGQTSTSSVVPFRASQTVHGPQCKCSRGSDQSTPRERRLDMSHRYNLLFSVGLGTKNTALTAGLVEGRAISDHLLVTRLLSCRFELPATSVSSRVGLFDDVDDDTWTTTRGRSGCPGWGEAILGFIHQGRLQSRLRCVVWHYRLRARDWCLQDGRPSARTGLNTAVIRCH